jgi:hypothetical protein
MKGENSKHRRILIVQSDTIGRKNLVIMSVGKEPTGVIAGHAIRRGRKISRHSTRRSRSTISRSGWRRPFPTAWLVSCAQHDSVSAGLAIWHASGRRSPFEMTAQDFRPWVRNLALVMPMLNKLKGAALLRYTLRNDDTISVRPYFGLANR